MNKIINFYYFSYFSTIIRYFKRNFLKVRVSGFQGFRDFTL